MLLLYFPKKCCFLSCLLFLGNQWNDISVYICEGAANGNKGGEQEGEAKGGSLLFPLTLLTYYTFLIIILLLPVSVRFILGCVCSQMTTTWRGPALQLVGGTPVWGVEFACAPCGCFTVTSWSRPLFDRKTRWCRFVFNELDPDAREGGGKKRGENTLKTE